MDSFKNAAGALTVVNTVIELTTLIWIIKKFNGISGEIDGKLQDFGGQFGKKIVEHDKNISQIAIAIKDITVALKEFTKTRTELIKAMNELHQSKAENDTRIDRRYKRLHQLSS